MKFWERAIQIEQRGEGLGLQGKLTKERIIKAGCPRIYNDIHMDNYSDDEVDNCRSFSMIHKYVPCSKCWDREYIINTK